MNKPSFGARAFWRFCKDILGPLRKHPVVPPTDLKVVTFNVVELPDRAISFVAGQIELWDDARFELDEEVEVGDSGERDLQYTFSLIKDSQRMLGWDFRPTQPTCSVPHRHIGAGGGHIVFARPPLEQMLDDVARAMGIWEPARNAASSEEEEGGVPDGR